MHEFPLFLVVADDDSDDRALLQFVINGSFPSWRYHMEPHGQALMDYLTNRPLDSPPISLILLDINMPLKNGIETVKDLRAWQMYQDIPIIAFSTSNNRSTIDKFMQAGGSAYFQKPTDIDQLQELLKQMAKLAL